MTGYIPSSVFYRGKCATCGGVTNLDEMVRKDHKKGLYHCIDCEVQEGDWVDDLEIFFTAPIHIPGIIKAIKNERKQTKVMRAMAWCFG